MRRVVAVLALVFASVGLASCSEVNVQAEDAYKIGCPAVDSAVAGGSVVSKATVAGLKKLSGSGQLDPEPQKWLDATIGVLDSDNPNASSDSAKKLIIDGCAQHGYPLRNLK